tara:strand:- start:195 stop:872 length:678 start_codon:yes stop_codon:yes gene_type:complete
LILKETFKVEIGKTPEPISLDTGVLGASQVFADEDTDQDGSGNLEDTDDDNDLVADETETILGTDPLNPDSDEDGLLDGEEIELGTNPLAQDTDQDGISDATEAAQGSNPLSKERKGEEVPKEQAEDSVVAKVTKQLSQEYLPAVAQQVNSLTQDTTEKLKEQRQKLKEKKEAFAAGESSKPLSVEEQSLDFLLAAAIITLPQWQIGLFLFFAIAAALLLRRLFS